MVATSSIHALITSAPESADMFYEVGMFASGSRLLQRDDILVWLDAVLADAPGELDKVADLTSYDASDKMFRYNCLDAAFGFKKREKQTHEGHGGQPGQFAGVRKRKEAMWSCPLLSALISEDLKALGLRATTLDRGVHPSTCDGRIMYLMTTDNHKLAKKGDFHVIFLAQHVMFQVNKRIVDTISQSPSNKEVTIPEIQKYFKCQSCSVFEFDETLPSSNTPLPSSRSIPIGAIVIVTDVWVWVHKRGTATPWLVHDAQNRVMSAKESLGPERFDYPEMRYGNMCHQRPLCISRIRPIETS
jgi:hypothetical protein